MTTTGNRAAVLGLVAGSILLLLPGIFAGAWVGSLIYKRILEA